MLLRICHLRDASRTHALCLRMPRHAKLTRHIKLTMLHLRWATNGGRIDSVLVELRAMVF